MPEELKVFTAMKYFSFNNACIFTGTIPSTIAKAWTELATFDVTSNNLSGRFPFTNNTLLRSIFLKDNNIEDDVKYLLASPSLDWLDAENNAFKGVLPDSMTTISHLRKIRVL